MGYKSVNTTSCGVLNTLNIIKNIERMTLMKVIKIKIT